MLTASTSNQVVIEEKSSGAKRERLHSPRKNRINHMLARSKKGPGESFVKVLEVVLGRRLV